MIIVAAFLLLVQSALIAALLVQRTRRRRVERELRESEERFHLMADTAPVLMWRADTNNLCDFVNRPWLEFTGRSMQQETGNGWADGVWPGDRERCLHTCVSAFEARRPFTMEFRLRRADGAYRWVLDTGVPRYGPDGSFAGYIGSCVDITDRKASEDALRESQQRYAMATAAGAVGVWGWDLEAGTLYVDPTLKSLLGFEDAEISTRPDDWGSRVHIEDAPAAGARIQECIDGHTDVYSMEHRMLHKDGSVRWFLSRGTVIRGADGAPRQIVGTKTDITDRRRAEDAIREQEAVLRASDREIQHLAGRLIAAQEAERGRIARDLHDDTSQQLAGLAIALSSLKRRLSPDDEGLQEDVSSLQQRAVTLAENVRHLSHDLHPSGLEHAGLIPALAAYCAEIQNQKAIEVTFATEGDFEPTDPAMMLCLYRVAQESLRNVALHAHASHAGVRLRTTSDSVELTIADDGRGFDIADVRGNREGLGLISISERVKLAGGIVSLSTEINKGTRVHVKFPSKRHKQSAAGDDSERYATVA